MEDLVPSRMNGLTAAGRNVVNPKHGVLFKKGKKKLIAKIVGAIFIIAFLTAFGLFLYQSNTSAAIESDKYQAVFLTNGQVYFGKLHTVNGSYMKLTDIYYLQTASTSTTSSLQSASSSSSSDVQLIKLGSEIHGPSDEMVISKDHILFFENLKKDGKVTSSITAYQAKK